MLKIYPPSICKIGSYHWNTYTKRIPKYISEPALNPVMIIPLTKPCLLGKNLYEAIIGAIYHSPYPIPKNTPWNIVNKISFDITNEDRKTPPIRNTDPIVIGVQIGIND